MRTMNRWTTVVLLAVMGLAANVLAQGSLDPAAAPEPTMKTLQEMWLELQTQRAMLNDLTFWARETDENVIILSNRIDALSRAQFPSVAVPLTMVVDTNAPTGQYCSLAFAPSGRPAISYRGSGAALTYTVWNGASWDAQTVDSSVNGWYTSLAFHPPSGAPAVSYYNQYSNDLKYAGWNGSGWTLYTVDSVGDVGMFTSLAFHPISGHPAISYYNYTSNDLKYAAWNGSSWILYTVDSAGDVGRYSSLAFSSAGVPCISYYEYVGVLDGRLKYAAWNGASWDIRAVDCPGDVGQYSSLAFAPSGNAGISYYDAGNGRLKYAEITQAP